MLKKIGVFFIISLTLFLSACSREEKFGIDEFAVRMNSISEQKLSVSDFMLGERSESEKYFFCEQDGLFISLTPDSGNKIKTFAVSAENGYDINKLLAVYLNGCCVLTGTGRSEQSATLKNCGIAAEKITYADSTSVNTVGKFKYTVVCSDYAVTLFCERV